MQRLSLRSVPNVPGDKIKPLISLNCSERCALFVDAMSLYHSARQLGFEVDYRKLLDFFRDRTTMIRAYYYSALSETEEYAPLRPLTDWLAYNGFILITKVAREFIDSTGRRRVRGSIDVELAVDMMEIAQRLDHAVLFSGGGNLRRLVEAVQRRGVRVTVISSLRTPALFVADELRRQADQFVDLVDFAPQISRRKESGQIEP